jgi:hypothetical protein
MFNQEQTGQNSGGSFKKYTGLALSKIVAINPTQEVLAEILNPAAAAKFNTQYALAKSPYGDQMVRPVTIWIQDVAEKMSPVAINLNLSMTDYVSKEGGCRFVNKHNITVSSKTGKLSGITDNPNMSWWSTEGARKVRLGEEEFNAFFTTLLRCIQFD